MAENLLHHKNWLFISFEQAARGHKLARVISALPTVYWFSHPDNGISPWNIGTHITASKQRHISKYHYDRLVPGGQLPPPYDYVRNYFSDPYEYYNTTFIDRFKSASGQDLLDQYMLPYCTHSTPDEILEFFPNAKIINIIHDVDECVDRYISVGSIFPGHVKHIGIVPSDNPYLSYLYEIESLISNSDRKLTLRDVWAFNHFNTEWNDNMMDELVNEIRNKSMYNKVIRENTKHANVLPLYDLKDYKRIKEFLF
jgi:hypothetical protein